MHLGHRGRAALGAIGVLTAGAVIGGVASGQYVAAAIGLLAGASCGVVVLQWGLMSTVGREVAALGVAVKALEKRLSGLQKQGARTVATQRRNQELFKRTHKQVQEYSRRLEQLSTQVSFPAVRGRAPGEPVSTRFADYLDQPASRSANRLEALLEQAARDAVERKAFEDLLRGHLEVDAEATPHPHQS